MARKKRTSKIPFVANSWETLNSRAYIQLSGSSGKALPYFLGKPKLFFTDPQFYLIDFSFPYAEAQRLGFATGTFSKVIQELVRTGFIDPVDKGGLRSDGKSYNRFKLSRRWEKFGTPDFDQLEWRCFQPKPRATSKSEMHSFKKENKKVSESRIISQIEAVGGILR